MEYPVYAEYKISTNNWIGQIPHDWDEKRIKFSLSYIGSGKTPKGGANVYVSDGIKLLRSQNVYDDGLRLNDVVFITDRADDLQASTRLKAGDILLNITGASIGRSSTVSINDLPANVNQHVCILRPNMSNILPTYLHKLLCSVLAKNQIQASENGTSREGLNFPQVGNLFFPFPEIPEQQKIANFLDYKTQQIDQLTEKKKALIEKLNEQRIAVITQAVTKGIDKNVKMKPSGVDWLGDVPEHWEVKRLRFAIETNPVKSKLTNIEDDDLVSFVPMEAVKEYGGMDATHTKLLEEVYTGYTYFRENDVVVAKITPCFENGKGAIAKNLNNGIGFGTTEFHVLRSPETIDEKYIFYLTITHSFRNIGASEMLGAGGQKRISDGFIKDFRLGMPEVKEQREIVSYLEKKLEEIDKVKNLSEQTISYYKEYRSSLITTAVTGKIDVRDFEIPAAKVTL